EERGAVEGVALHARLAGAGGGLFQDGLRGAPVFQNGEDGCVSRLARELCGIEDLLADDQPGARTVRRLVGCKLETGHFPVLPRSLVCRVGWAKSSAVTCPRGP